MKNWFLRRLYGSAQLFVLVMLGVVVLFGDVSSAQDFTIQGGANSARGVGQPINLFSGDNSIFRTITDILLFLVGAIAVIMLVIGGIRYVVSGGNQAAVTAAKNTIMYAIIGIVVAFMSYAAVDFVLGSLVVGSDIE